jgi:hypothetical protein
MFEKMHVLLGGFFIGCAGTAVTDSLEWPADTVGTCYYLFRVFSNPDADAF